MMEEERKNEFISSVVKSEMIWCGEISYELIAAEPMAAANIIHTEIRAQVKLEIDKIIERQIEKLEPVFYKDLPDQMKAELEKCIWLPSLEQVEYKDMRIYAMKGPREMWEYEKVYRKRPVLWNEKRKNEE